MTADTPLRARYVGYTKGTENHGDESLVWIIRELLAPEIDVVTEGDRFDIALLGGGTLINQSPWLIDCFTEMLGKARLGVVFGSGVGDPRFWGHHFGRWIPLLDRCALTAVRGPHSERLLISNGYENAEVIGDPYLVLRPPLERRPSPRTIGINFGSTNESLLGGDEPAFFETLRGLLLRLIEEGWKLRWIPVWSKDFELMHDIRESMPCDPGPLVDARTDSLEALSCISGCEVFLGEKLHALAMSAVCGTPFLALEYQPKVRDFTASLGMEAWTFPTSERNVETLMKRLEQLSGDRARIAARLKRAVEEKRADILDFARRVRESAVASRCSE